MTLSAWKLLGFDAREDELEGRKTPVPFHVREVFLLRPEIELPYSVDGHVWPSVWGMNDGPQIEENGLWLNLDGLRRSLKEQGRRAILIAVELLIPPNMTAPGFPYSLIDSTPDPPTVSEDGICLGFDVADSGFWSGLSNCGYSEDAREKLRPEWQSKINDFGLLRTEQDALMFRDLTDTRVPDHGPFWVYKLYRLPESG
jgi:hypothetical protein